MVVDFGDELAVVKEHFGDETFEDGATVFFAEDMELVENHGANVLERAGDETAVDQRVGFFDGCDGDVGATVNFSTAAVREKGLCAEDGARDVATPAALLAVKLDGSKKEKKTMSEQTPYAG